MQNTVCSWCQLGKYEFLNVGTTLIKFYLDRYFTNLNENRQTFLNVLSFWWCVNKVKFSIKTEFFIKSGKFKIEQIFMKMLISLERRAKFANFGFLDGLVWSTQISRPLRNSIKTSILTKFSENRKKSRFKMIFMKHSASVNASIV